MIFLEYDRKYHDIFRCPIEIIMIFLEVREKLS